MKRILAVLTLVLSMSVAATPVLINDGYVGGNDHGYGDVIGDASMFGIDSMSVDLVGTILTVQINTLFGDNGLGSFTSLTNTTLSGSKGIGFGDLFLSSAGWNPSGAAPYLGDDNSTGTLWNYGIALTDRWDPSSTASLYSLNGLTNNSNAYLSDDFLSGGTFRNGQEVAVDTGSTTTTALANAATFSTLPGQILFTLDIAGTTLESAGAIGLHWAMTCGNDTMEGEYVKVPEPATLAIMLSGLLGLLVFAGRRRSRTQSIYPA